MISIILLYILVYIIISRLVRFEVSFVTRIENKFVKIIYVSI